MGTRLLFLSLCWQLATAMSIDAAEPGKKDLPADIAGAFAPPAEFADDFGTLASPLKFADGSLVKTPDDWQRRRAEILKTWHDLMGPWPPAVEKPRMEVLEASQRDGLTRQHIRLEVAPNTNTEEAYLLIPEGKGPFPAVLVVFYDGRSSLGESKTKMCDFGLQLSKRGFVTLSIGTPPGRYDPKTDKVEIQPLSYLAYVASNCRRALAGMPNVDAERIGVVGHSYGGKWAMFASCLDDKFACAVWSDGGIVFDEKRANVNYWEPWYLGLQPKSQRKEGVVTESNPRTGAYKAMVDQGHDLHELHALMAPRPFLVSGGSEDRPERWKALNHSIAVNKLLGCENRVAMTNRRDHQPTEESNAQLVSFFVHALKP